MLFNFCLNYYNFSLSSLILIFISSVTLTNCIVYSHAWSLYCFIASYAAECDCVSVLRLGFKCPHTFPPVAFFFILFIQSFMYEYIQTMMLERWFSDKEHFLRNNQIQFPVPAWCTRVSGSSCRGVDENISWTLCCVGTTYTWHISIHSGIMPMHIFYFYKVYGQTDFLSDKDMWTKLRTRSSMTICNIN